MLKNLKIGARLYILTGLLSLLLIIIGVLGLQGEGGANASLETVYNDRLVPASLLSEINSLMRKNVEELLLAQLHDPRLPVSKIHEANHPITKHTDAVEANKQRVDKLWAQLMASNLTHEEKILVERFIADRKIYVEVWKRWVELLKEKKFDDANLQGTMNVMPIYKQLEQERDALIQLQVEVAKEEKDKAEANYANTRSLTITSIIGGILLALGIGLWIIRSIVGRVTESAVNISTTASQIAVTITQHERTASQQAAAANETSATITELSASSRQSAEQAANAAAIAEKARVATVQGGNITQQTVLAMSSLKDRISAMSAQILHLSEQTGQIGGIATLVKDLSGEINMLALNAAVEAARAGEHGKGFAVVASEVRKLAIQSKKSAEQATALVADIQKATNSSIMMTEEGAHTVAEITLLAQSVSDLFNNLSGMAASVNENSQQVMLNAKQQSAAFIQVVEATNSIASGAKETAAGISQTKIGVQKLNEAAENLKAIA